MMQILQICKRHSCQDLIVKSGNVVFLQVSVQERDEDGKQQQQQQKKNHKLLTAFEGSSAQETHRQICSECHCRSIPWECYQSKTLQKRFHDFSLCGNVYLQSQQLAKASKNPVLQSGQHILIQFPSRRKKKSLWTIPQRKKKKEKKKNIKTHKVNICELMFGSANACSESDVKRLFPRSLHVKIEIRKRKENCWGKSMQEKKQVNAQVGEVRHLKQRNRWQVVAAHVAVCEANGQWVKFRNCYATPPRGNNLQPCQRRQFAESVWTVADQIITQAPECHRKGRMEVRAKKSEWDGEFLKLSWVCTHKICKSGKASNVAFSSCEIALDARYLWMKVWREFLVSLSPSLFIFHFCVVITSTYSSVIPVVYLNMSLGRISIRFSLRSLGMMLNRFFFVKKQKGEKKFNAINSDQTHSILRLVNANVEDLVQTTEVKLFPRILLDGKRRDVRSY